MRVPFSPYLIPRGRAAAKEFGSFTTAHRGGREAPIFFKIVFLSVFSSVFSVTSVVSLPRSFRTPRKRPFAVSFRMRGNKRKQSKTANEPRQIED